MLTPTRSHRGTRATGLVGPKSALVRELTAAYWHELESVASHLTSSTDRDGIHAERIAAAINQAIAADLKHAQQVAIRIRQLHGTPPGADQFAAQKLRLRPPAESLDDDSVLTSLFEAEIAAIERYRRIAALALEAHDWITQGLVNRIMREKETHGESLRERPGDRAVVRGGRSCHRGGMRANTHFILGPEPET